MHDVTTPVGLQCAAADLALALPEAELTQPFGPDHDVYRVGGRLFVMTTDAPRLGPVVTLKCDPAYSRILREQHPTIHPGYHMNKRHWISLTPGPGIDDALLQELVTAAYLLIHDSLPRRARPALPDHLRADARV